MRVLTFLHSFEPGGVERDALRLNDEWAKLGVDVRIVLGRRDGRLAEEAPDFQYSVLQQGTLSTALFETLWMIAKLPAAVRAIKPDVLFCAGNTYSIVAVAMRMLLGRRCPPIVLRVSNDLCRKDLPSWQRWFYRRWLRFQAPFFDAVVAMAAPIAPEIAEEMNLCRDDVRVIENGSIRLCEAIALADARDTAVPSPAGRHFLAVGRLARQKNFPLLLDSFAAICGRDDHLTIVGEGDQRGALERQAQKLGITDRISMPGHYNPLGSFFARANAYVLSSDYEGLPAVIVEALAAGLPIVATDCSTSMAMLVENAGILVPIKNVAALGDAMDGIAAQPVDITAMRARARMFSVETTAPEWIALFDRLPVTLSV